MTLWIGHSAERAFFFIAKICKGPEERSIKTLVCRSCRDPLTIRHGNWGPFVDCCSELETTVTNLRRGIMCIERVRNSPAKKGTKQNSLSELFGERRRKGNFSSNFHRSPINCVDELRIENLIFAIDHPWNIRISIVTTVLSTRDRNKSDVSRLHVVKVVSPN